jgi:hypothetical protein
MKGHALCQPRLQLRLGDHLRQPRAARSQIHDGGGVATEREVAGERGRRGERAKGGGGACGGASAGVEEGV